MKHLTSMAAAACLPYFMVSAIQIGNSGYYENHYYEFITDKAMYDEAVTLAGSRQKCGTAGYLASIDSQEENDFLESFIRRPRYDRRQGYEAVFIGLNDKEVEGDFVWESGEAPTFHSWATDQPNNYGRGEDCVILESDGQWDDVKCTKKYPSIIEYACPQDWTPVEPVHVSAGPHGHHFYKVYSGRLSYHEMKEFAESAEYCGTTGYLASITDQDENDHVKSLAEGLENVFIGYDDIRDEGTFSWHSGEGTEYENWALGQPDDSGAGEDCVTMNLEGEWMDTECDEVDTFVVEFDCPLVHTRKLDESEPPNYGNHYYELVMQRKKYASARADALTRTYCGVNGYLAVVTDQDEHDFLKNLAGKKRAYIGLNDLTTEDVYTWVNGEEYVYESWAKGQPDNKGNQDCVHMHYGNWKDISCSKKLPYFVEYDCGSATPRTIDAMVSGEYGNHFYEVFSDVMTYEKAVDFARNREHCGMPGYLAVLTNPGENNFVMSLSEGKMTPRIGLDDIETVNDYKWASGEEFGWTNWADAQPKNQNSQDCVRMNTAGRWEDVRCDTGLPLVVEFDCGVAPVYRAPAMASGDHGNHFYEVFDDRMTYEEATRFANEREHCGAPGYLAVITNPPENDFIESLLDTKSPFIGLNDLATENDYTWVNGEESDFVNWATGQPDNNNDKDCVRMLPGGLWKDEKCTNAEPFVVEYDCGIAPVYRAPALASGEYGNHFYEVFDEFPKTYEEAKLFASKREHCEMKGYLAVITDPLENEFVEQLLNNKKAFIGLDDLETEDAFSWVNGQEFDWTNWAPGQPNNSKNNQDCVRMKENGQWEDERCDEKRPYVVEYDCGLAPVYREPAMSSGEYGNHFYEVFYDRKRTYADAERFAARREYCGMTGYLAVITNPTENEFVESLLNNKQAYIGLNDVGTESDFTWVNGEDFLWGNWLPGQPNNKRDEDCARMHVNGQWDDQDCGDAEAFVVEYDCGVAPRAPAMASGEHGNHFYEVFDSKMTYEKAQGFAAKREHCGKTGYLAVITNPPENDFIKSLLGGSSGLIGLDDLAVEDDFTWVNSEEFFWENWARGQPNNKGNQDCVLMKSSGEWEDDGCTKAFNFVVEYDCGVAPVYREPALGSGEYGNHFYEVFDEPMTYAKAQEFARRREYCGTTGHLAVITNSLENAFVESILNNKQAFIGLNDIGTESDFTWVNGEEYDWKNWLPGQPNNKRNEDCARMHVNGRWDDQDCGDAEAFVVEYDCGVAPIYRAPALASGEYGNHFYEVFADHKTYENAQIFAAAREHCSKTGYLAVVTNQDENQFIKSLLAGTKPYIGLTDDESEGDFTWTNGEEFHFENWARNQPNGVNKQNCVRMIGSGQWEDDNCEQARPFVVEYDCGVAPVWRPSPYNTGNYGNHYYEFYNTKMTYAEAKSFAEAAVFCGKNGYLATISHEAENSFIKSKLDGKRVLIGLADVDDNSVFTWANNDPFLYDNWDKGQPSHWGKGEDCTRMRENGKWHDVKCDNLFNFVVEYDCGLAPAPPGPMPMSSGEYGNHYYQVFDIQKSYEDAKVYASNLVHCEKQGYLAIISDAGENEFIFKLIGDERPYIGLADKSNEGEFRWVNGDPLAWNSWAPNQPNPNHGKGEDCVHMRHDGKWNDVKCSRRSGFVVEFDCGIAPPYTGPPPLESGFFGNHFYEVYEESKTYAEAATVASNKNHCGHNGYLAAITSESENIFLAAKLSGTSPWIGIDDMATEGTHSWQNGEEVSFMGWARGKSSGSGQNRDCVKIGGGRSAARWDHQKCSNRYGYIVEYDCSEAPPAAAQLICDGPSALVWGDPHIETYDNLKYDCQGRGEFVIAKSLDSHFEVQGRFESGARESITVTRSVVFSTGEQGVPTIQVDVPSGTDSETCTPSFFVEKNNKNDLLEQEGKNDLLEQGIEVWESGKTSKRKGKTVTFRYIATGMRIDVSSKLSKKNGCVLAIQVCLPENGFAQERIVGLLGSPSGSSVDDWMNPTKTVEFEIPDKRRGQEAYNYCVENWCIKDSDSSMFRYPEGKDFSSYNYCSADYQDNGLSEAIANLDLRMVQICDGNDACLVDAAIGGIEDAEAAVEVAVEMEEVQFEAPQFALNLAPPAPSTPVTSGYWGNHYYEIFRERMTYSDATEFANNREFCGQKGYLAVINQDRENNFIRKKMRPLRKTPGAWIGFDDREVEGSFVWQSGETPFYLAWANGEPSGTNADCAVMGVPSSRTWSTKPCSDEFAFVVEYSCALAPPIKKAKLVCSGDTARFSGDPHLTTFDGLRYDCQGEGEFIMATSMGSDFEMQGRFVKAGRRKVTVTRAVVWTTGEEGSPKIQVTVPDNAPGCPLEVHINNESTPVLIEGTGYPELLSVGGTSKSLIFQYETGTRIRVSVKSSENFGCVLHTDICLSPSQFDDQTIIGLLGTPDENKTNDWMNQAGEFIPVSINKRFEDAYNYCVNNWCLRDSEDSMFVYPDGMDFEDFYKCGEIYDDTLEQELVNVPDNIQAVCAGDMGCIMDGLLGDVDDAQNLVDDEEEAFVINLAPPANIVPETTEVFTSIENCDQQAPCMIITIEEMDVGSCVDGGASKQYEVCLELDLTNSECAKTSTQSVGHSCIKDDLTCQTDPSGLPGVSFAGSTMSQYLPDLHEQCQIAGPGVEVQFLLMDGQGCETSGTHHVAGYGNALCEPTETQSCSSEDNIGKECVWTFLTPGITPASTPASTPTPDATPASIPTLDTSMDIDCDCVDSFITNAVSQFSISSEMFPVNGGVLVHRRIVETGDGVSYTDAVIVVIDDDTFEVSHDHLYYLNGVATGLPATIGGYPIALYTQGSKSSVVVDFGNGEELVLRVFSGTRLKTVSVRSSR